MLTTSYELKEALRKAHIQLRHPLLRYRVQPTGRRLAHRTRLLLKRQRAAEKFAQWMTRAKGMTPVGATLGEVLGPMPGPIVTER